MSDFFPPWNMVWKFIEIVPFQEVGKKQKEKKIKVFILKNNFQMTYEPVHDKTYYKTCVTNEDRSAWALVQSNQSSLMHVPSTATRLAKG